MYATPNSVLVLETNDNGAEPYMAIVYGAGNSLRV
jgi:hypothetical protein